MIVFFLLSIFTLKAKESEKVADILQNFVREASFVEQAEGLDKLLEGFRTDNCFLEASKITNFLCDDDLKCKKSLFNKYYKPCVKNNENLLKKITGLIETFLKRGKK
jgi:hypothetical protein